MRQTVCTVFKFEDLQNKKQATFLALLLVDWVKPQCENKKTERLDFIVRDQNEIKRDFAIRTDRQQAPALI